MNLRKMSLRKSLFLIIILFGAIGAGAVYITLFVLNSIVPYCCICRTPFSFLRWLLPFVASVLMPTLAVTTFYRLKLKTPLSKLERGTKKIMENDLDFSIDFRSKDELGQLCQSFEIMREKLMESNQEVWQKMEERKRLNAAFAHDLRNPVTVLKGSASMLQKKVDEGDLSAENGAESVALISQYTQRIESYIKAMTSVQKLEELPLSPKKILWSALINELDSSLAILTAGTGKELKLTSKSKEKFVVVDQDIIHNVAENLVSNGLRYAKGKVGVSLTQDDNKVTLKVTDDGSGFSSKILEKGVVPFLRNDQEEQGEHFGMGLYICHLLCKKHEGTLILENELGGAKITATFKS